MRLASAARAARAALARRSRALALAALAPSTRSPPTPTPSQPIAFVGGLVHTLAGPAIEGGTVVVRAGAIVAVGAAIEVPAGARVIDAEGLVIAPGFFDSMSTLGLSEIPSVAATQDTAELGAWNPHLRALDAVNPASEHILVARANGVTHAGAAPAGSGYGIPGRAAAIRLDGWTNQEMAIAPEIGVVRDLAGVDDSTLRSRHGALRRSTVRRGQEGVRRSRRRAARLDRVGASLRVGAAAPASRRGRTSICGSPGWRTSPTDACRSWCAPIASARSATRWSSPPRSRCA